MNYIEIQNAVIRDNNITIVENSECWRRTHAHVRDRKICKWKQANSVASTFTLLHEVGHVVTTKRSMRRVESEYFATMWAIEQCHKYGITIPEKTKTLYQQYIDRTLDRGIRRGGSGYQESFKLSW